MTVPVFFESPRALRDWFDKHGDLETALLVGFYKVKTGKAVLGWSEAVDEALCYGWIDGVRKSIDDHHYMIRFTPRKTGSTWSGVNIRKAEALIAAGKMKAAGLKAYQNRQENKSRLYSYEKKPVSLSKEFLKKFNELPGAWQNFQNMAPSYQRVAIHWVMTAKQETTRNRRMQMLLEDSAAGIKLKPFRYAKHSPKK